MSKTTIPGIKAQHAIISDQCRTGRGEMEAFDEAVRRCRQAYEQSCGGWKVGMGANLHLVLTVERPLRPSHEWLKAAADAEDKAAQDVSPSESE